MVVHGLLGYEYNMSNEQSGETITWQSGPSDPPRLADGPSTVVTVDIAAPAADVWKLASDINFGGPFSEEFNSARWAKGVSEPSIGAQFIGNNTNDAMGTWEVPCFVSHYEPERAFGWVTSDPNNPGAQWRFDLDPSGDSTRLSYSLTLGPGPSGLTAFVEANPDMESRAVISRMKGLRANMASVVEAIKDAATS